MSDQSPAQQGHEHESPQQQSPQQQSPQQQSPEQQTPEQTLAQPLGGGDLDAALRSAGGGVSRVTLVLSGVALVVLAFVAGIFVDKSLSNASPAAAQGGGAARANGRGNGGGYNGGGGGGPFGGGAGGGRGTAGTVDHVDNGTVYVKLPDGTIVKVTTSDSTRVSVTKNGSLADLTVGSTVVVQGQTGSDGTVTAQQITQRAATG